MGRIPREKTKIQGEKKEMNNKLINKPIVFEHCWICGSDMPSMKVAEALRENPDFLDGHTHNGSLSRFDNASYVCDECGNAESSMGLLMTSLSSEWKALISSWMDEAQKRQDKEMWKAAICMVRGSLIGYSQRSHQAFQSLMDRM